MERLTEKHWRNLDPWECCGQDRFCHRGCHDMGGCTNGCIVPKLYVRLASYEDTGLTPEEIMAAANRRHDCKIDCLLEAHNKLLDDVQGLGGIDKIKEVMQAPNDPLTLEELREMDGEPVWCECKDAPKYNGWYLVNASERTLQIARNKRYSISRSAIKSGFWLAYRRRPEEEAE